MASASGRSNQLPVQIDTEQEQDFTASANLELDTPTRRVRLAIRADNDEDAIDSYLEEYKDSPNTRRIYAKELRRFLIWTRDFAHRRFAHLMRDDLRDFENFLRNPPSHLIGDTRAPYGVEGWCPFRGPLGNDACHQALRVNASFLDWLVQAGYLSANPMGLVRQKRSKVKAERGDRVRPMSAARHGLTAEAVKFLFMYLDAMPRRTAEEIETAARAELVIQILVTTGARRSELANASVNNLVCRNDRWRLYVIAKGGDVGTLQIGEEAIKALKAYNLCRGLSELPHIRDNRPVIAQIGNPAEGISDNMLYRIVKRVMGQAALLAGAHGATNAKNQLEQASTHWLRHTSISKVADSTGNLRVTKGFGRHASADTTLGYMNIESDELHDQVTPVFDSMIEEIKK
ncbi:MAG: hypothetical protein AzoDbin1_04627 [Azoarcus sp.]|nr:hypothetical protein [Azoarcus sp.]